MPSPFPGMDPYLEQYWRDIHARLIIYACDQLQPKLPADLRARVEERVFVESPQGNGHSMYPDVRVVERGGRGEAVAATSGQAAVAESLVIHLEEELATEGFLEIIDVGSGNKVVTVIEFLSLSNKQPGDGQDQYRRKQRELKDGRVSLVEIDLLREGQRVLCVPLDRIPPSHRTTYQVCVRRGWTPTKIAVFAVPLRNRLPNFRVPLREADEDVLLDLQPLIEQCFRNGGYDNDIDYRRDPVPPLSPEDAAWADGWLKNQGRR